MEQLFDTHILPVMSPDSELPIDYDQELIQDNQVMPLLPLRRRVLFPRVLINVNVTRPAMRKMVKKYSKSKELITVCTQHSSKTENPQLSDIYNTGVAAQILNVITLPDNTLAVMLLGIERVLIKDIVEETPYLTAHVDPIPEPEPERTPEFNLVINNIQELYTELFTQLPKEILNLIKQMKRPEMLLNFIACNYHFSTEEKMDLLKRSDIHDRALQLLSLLRREHEMLELQNRIKEQTQSDIDKQQKEYFLHQQIQTIQKELGEDDGESLINEFRERAEKKQWSKAIADTFEKELKRLQRLHPHSSDYTVQVNYLDTILDLPWDTYTQDNYDLDLAQKVLDRDHFGMEKVKERVLEHLAILKMKQDMKAPILCLYGPPGVGKTSLGKSIAEALGRKYTRVALGGMHDESELRGHRRTYVGALPGRILQNLCKVGSGNPVFILDEVDKICADYKGDPTSALLEILDPEQNNAFHDNFLDIDYDLSKVLFIATANKIGDIPRPLRDRMEMIEMSGYLQEEKVEIARKHLLPKALKEHGLKAKDLKINKTVLDYIIEKYTRESGVRELGRQLAQVARKVVRKVAAEQEYNVSITKDDVREYLGYEKFSRDMYEGNAYPGVVTGLAWTAVGGEILFIEASTSPSKAFQLTMTGQLGDVMKESATLAMNYIRAHAKDFGVDLKALDKTAVHIHVPEGAVPKDGPSAGITMTTALVSALTKRKVRKNLAMTGEITLRGKVLPVGGIKEKILAAKRAGITDIMLCQENQKDIEEINPIYVKGLRFHYVSDIHEVIEFAVL